MTEETAGERLQALHGEVTQLTARAEELATHRHLLIRDWALGGRAPAPGGAAAEPGSGVAVKQRA